MRPTVTPPDPLLVAARQLATQRRTSSTAILEQGLRDYLASRLRGGP